MAVWNLGLRRLRHRLLMVGPGQNRELEGWKTILQKLQKTNSYTRYVSSIHGFHCDPVLHNSTITLICQKRQSRSSHRWPECSNSQIALLVRTEWKYTRTRPQTKCSKTTTLGHNAKMRTPFFWQAASSERFGIHGLQYLVNWRGLVVVQLVFEMSHNHVQKTQAKAEKV